MYPVTQLSTLYNETLQRRNHNYLKFRRATRGIK